MALSIVLGASGSGKSTYVYEKILAEARENKDKNFLVIVPEQYTMATQRLLVQMHENHCIMNIDILSFNRLAYRIFEELGVESLDILDDVGKSLVLRKLVNDKLEEIGVLKKNITKISYITQIKSLISEMTQYNITPDVLREMIGYGPMSESFRRKASDLLVMYEAFNEFTEGKYITTEAILSTLNGVIADSRIVSGSTVVLDGFTGFTPLQYELVESMLGMCDEVMVTVTGDINESYIEKKADDELFSMSADFVSALTRCASHCKASINDPVLIDNKNSRFANNEALAHLEANLFRNDSHKYEKDNSSEVIELATFKDSRQELEHAAIRIRELVKNAGYSFKDCAIVCPNLESYRYQVDDIFKNYEIPFFVDAKTEILFTPFVEMISAIFEIFDTNFSKEAVFRYLRTGFTELTNEEIDYFENYIRSTGIRGKNKYFHPFAIRSSTYRQPDDLLKVNEIRQTIIKPFQLLDAELEGDTTVRKIAIGLYNFIISLNCEEKIQKRGEWHEQNNNPIRAKEYSQIYKVVMALLEKMVAILGDQQMARDEFADIFEAGLSSATIGIIPPANDSVIIGDMERTRIDGIKVLFCLGASDDAIPKKIENGGILSQIEREQLLEKFELAPSDRQRAFRQRFYIYMMLTKPSEKLIITAPRVNADGKACGMSYLFDTISRMFQIKTCHQEQFSFIERISTVYGAKNLLIELINKVATLGLDSISEEEYAMLLSLMAWAKESRTVDLNRLLDTAFYSHQRECVSYEAMEIINEAFNQGDKVSGSVSKFECYSDCAFKFFIRYILRLNEREEASLSSIDIGNFNHEALEKYGKLLKADNKKWRDITKDEQEAYIDMAFKQTYESMDKVATIEDPTQRYIVEALRLQLQHAVEMITEQVKRGTFEPELFEEQINAEILDQKSGQTIANLKGKVDRIDLSDEIEGAVRIVDYKSSSHVLSLQKVFYGLSLQLPIYMGVVLDRLGEKYKDIDLHPSALLYYSTHNPFIDRIGGEPLFETFLGSAQMSGLVCHTDEDIFANDKTLDPKDNPESLVVPIKYKKDGLTKNSSVISRENMDVLLDYSKYKAGLIAKDILEGEFDCSPADMGDGHCRHCEYHGICHFDSKIEGYEINELYKMKDDEDALGAMKDALGIHDDNEVGDGAN